MKWKRFKKERISLNYTVMLLPHSQKNPIHFKTPVWTFGLIFLAILVLSGTCLFFAGSRAQLEVVRQEKEQLEMEKENLEQEWQLLAAQKQMADEENESLRQARTVQEQKLKELEQRTRDTITELKELVEREDQIRQELGLEESQEETESQSGEEDSQPAEMLSEGEQTGSAQQEDAQLMEAVPTFSHTARTMSFSSIQSELSYLQNSLSEVSGQYDHYLTTIEEKKAAAAAEVARKKALRQTIVSDALQFVGNAYVYGGNDPYTGVDCSGFTKYVLGHTAGVYLNRTAASQSAQGRAVSAQEARPGDLVFYSSGGSIDHVAIYMGDGKIVHASNSQVGIITSDMYYRTPAKIVNVLGD
jgi:cell wall-associated NlpC family hydrolase